MLFYVGRMIKITREREGTCLCISSCGRRDEYAFRKICVLTFRVVSLSFGVGGFSVGGDFGVKGHGLLVW